MTVAVGTEHTNASSCYCTDPDLEVLRQLVDEGYDQMEVSRLLWAPGTPVSNAVARAHAGRWARRYVRVRLKELIPDLRISSRGPGVD